jgi:hypothetical protein
MLMLVLALFLSFPSYTRAGDSSNGELRLLDLEVEMLSLKSQMLSLEQVAINARLHEATRERAQQNSDLEREIRESYAGRHPVAPSSVLELDHITVLDPPAALPHDAPTVAAARGPVGPPCRRNSARGCGVL